MAARLWWMLRYMGHAKVAVLDGGWQGWKAAGLPKTAGLEQNISATFTGNPHTEWLVVKDEVQAGVPLLVDARAPERYRGEVEPLDRIAGHIPEAVNYYFQDNLDENGRFHPPDHLRRQLQTILGSADPDQAVFYCGSGVTACHNLLALTHAGLGNGRLYAGSWSDWIAEGE
jgi:thiosulfate/3-mercaptopyruvate sulfurtransferase